MTVNERTHPRPSASPSEVVLTETHRFRPDEGSEHRELCPGIYRASVSGERVLLQRYGAGREGRFELPVLARREAVTGAPVAFVRFLPSLDDPSVRVLAVQQERVVFFAALSTAPLSPSILKLKEQIYQGLILERALTPFQGLFVFLRPVTPPDWYTIPPTVQWFDIEWLYNSWTSWLFPTISLSLTTYEDFDGNPMPFAAIPLGTGISIHDRRYHAQVPFLSPPGPGWYRIHASTGVFGQPIAVLEMPH